MKGIEVDSNVANEAMFKKLQCIINKTTQINLGKTVGTKTYTK